MRSERKQDKCNTLKTEPHAQPINTVKTSIIRDAVYKYLKENDTTLAHVAYKMNWTVLVRGEIRGDGSRLRRALGLRPDQELDPFGNRKYRKTMQFKTATTIIRAIERDPWEFDL